MASKKQPSMTELLLDLTRTAEFFHTPDGEPFVTFPTNHHRETHRVGSSRFKSWLTVEFFKAHQQAADKNALENALQTASAKALAGPTHEVYLRIAGCEDRTYVDLGNSKWEAVECDPGGWRVVSNPPIKFQRVRNTAPLPTPVRGGSITELQPFLNLKDEEDWILSVSWIVGAFHPNGPYPVLALYGGQGTAKSTTARLLKRLIDPAHKAELRTLFKAVDDCAITATTSHVLSYENISHLQQWQSDILCSMSTGGGYGTRQFYTNGEEVVFDFRRPVCLNGITDFITSNDLLDRSIGLSLPEIAENRRRAEGEYWKEFNEALPSILGGFLDAICVGLRNLDSISLEKMPRMADFAKWIAACEPALPWKPGSFLDAYDSNRREVQEEALDCNVVAQVVIKYVRNLGEWRGSSTELLSELKCHFPELVQLGNDWPKTAKGLSNTLKRDRHLLKSQGIEFKLGEKSNGRRLTHIWCSDRVAQGRNRDEAKSETTLPKPQETQQVTPNRDERDDTAGELPPSSVQSGEKREVIGKRSKLPICASLASLTSLPPTKRCYSCGERNWWQIGSRWTCGCCHPPIHQPDLWREATWQ